MELKWTVAAYVNILFPCLGGLHGCSIFQGVIGTHMKDSGLVEIWTDSGILGINAANQVICWQVTCACQYGTQVNTTSIVADTLAKTA